MRRSVLTIGEEPQAACDRKACSFMFLRKRCAKGLYLAGPSLSASGLKFKLT